MEYLDGGNLDDLVQHALGLVTVNSTAGLHALQMSCPVITLGQAVHDVPDLTFQGELDEFWKRPSRPDTQLLEAFINLMVATTQIRGCSFQSQAALLRSAQPCGGFWQIILRCNDRDITPDAGVFETLSY